MDQKIYNTNDTNDIICVSADNISCVPEDIVSAFHNNDKNLISKYKSHHTVYLESFYKYLCEPSNENFNVFKSLVNNDEFIEFIKRINILTYAIKHKNEKMVEFILNDERCESLIELDLVTTYELMFNNSNILKQICLCLPYIVSELLI